MPLDALDIPSVPGKDTLLAAFCERPDAHGRIVTGSREALVIWREAESAYGLTMCRPRSEVVHVRLEILDDSGLVCRSDIGAGVIEGEGTDSGIVRLKNGLKVERQTIPSCKLSARRTGQDAAALRRPLGAMLGAMLGRQEA